MLIDSTSMFPAVLGKRTEMQRKMCRGCKKEFLLPLPYKRHGTGRGGGREGRKKGREEGRKGKLAEMKGELGRRNRSMCLETVVMASGLCLGQMWKMRLEIGRPRPQRSC